MINLMSGHKLKNVEIYRRMMEEGVWWSELELEVRESFHIQLHSKASRKLCYRD